MRKQILTLVGILVGVVSFAQSGHIMQGVGAVNMSMGRAATAQPLDVNGTIQWKPTALSAFDGKMASLSVGTFFSSPELSSSYGSMSGTIQDEHATSIMPAIAYVWSKLDCKHTFNSFNFWFSNWCS